MTDAEIGKHYDNFRRHVANTSGPGATVPIGEFAPAFENARVNFGIAPADVLDSMCYAYSQYDLCKFLKDDTLSWAFFRQTVAKRAMWWVWINALRTHHLNEGHEL